MQRNFERNNTKRKKVKIMKTCHLVSLCNKIDYGHRTLAHGTVPPGGIFWIWMLIVVARMEKHTRERELTNQNVIPQNMLPCSFAQSARHFKHFTNVGLILCSHIFHCRVQRNWHPFLCMCVFFFPLIVKIFQWNSCLKYVRFITSNEYF